MGGKQSIPPPPNETGVFVHVAAARNYAKGSGGFTVYDIRFRYRVFEWEVSKRFSEICTLHRKISGLPGFTLKRPSKTFRRNVNSMFVNTRLQQLQVYLQGAYSQKAVWAHSYARVFAEVSRLSFDRRLGRKGREGWLKKRSGGHNHISNDVFTNWRKRWFVVKDNCVVYFLNPNDPKPRGVVLVDDTFAVKAIGKRILEISNRTRKLALWTPSYRHTCEWLDALRQFYGPGCVERVKPHISGSFAPVRHYSNAAWLVDGEATFAAITNAIEGATKEIFISDWWLSPDVQLVRRRAWQRVDSPGHHSIEGGDGIEVRLTVTEMLWRAATRGVKIYILLYKDVGMGLLVNDSKGAKKLLQEISTTNVFVMRHPDHMTIGRSTLLWTHHDKAVIVDQHIAFLGGIDLCYGRYDNWKHQLRDYPDETHGLWAGGDFYNPAAAEAISCARNIRETLYSRTHGTVQSATDAATAQLGAAQSAGLGFLARASDIVADVAVQAEAVTGEVVAAVASELGTPTSTPRGEQAVVAPARPSVPSHTGAIVVPTAVLENSTEETPPTSVATAAAAAAVPEPSQPPAVPPRRTGSDVVVGTPITDKPASAPAVAPASSTPVVVGTPISTTTPRQRASAPAAFNNRRYTYDDGNRIPNPAHHPRLPWHDIHMRVEGPAAVDLAMHFIQRWNHHRLVKSENNVPWLIPACDHRDWCGAAADGEVEASDSLDGASVSSSHSSGSSDTSKSSTSSDSSRESGALSASVPATGSAAATAGAAVVSATTPRAGTDSPLPIVKPFTPAVKEVIRAALKNSCLDFTDCSVQILRSVGPWSIGIQTENSVYQAYMSLIKSAQHFIYIENQYFISATGPGDRSGVKNRIGEALVNRISQAIQHKQAFRVIVVLPAHPEGDQYTNRSVKAVMHNMFQSISRGPHSILSVLRQRHPDQDPFDYISFFSLRQEDALPNGNRVTEQIYVHSKLMIIDDNVAVIGSANLNDRSMAGDRDSEVVAVVSGGGVTPSLMNGRQWQAGSFACTLRRRLWRQHLGLMDTSATPPFEMDVVDPICDATYFGVWMRAAITNTFYFERKYEYVAQLTGLSVGRVRHPRSVRYALLPDYRATRLARSSSAPPRPLPPAVPPRTTSKRPTSVVVGTAIDDDEPSVATGPPVDSASGAVLGQPASIADSSAAMESKTEEAQGTTLDNVDAMSAEAVAAKIQATARTATRFGTLVWYSMAFMEGQDMRPSPLTPEGLAPSKMFQ